MNFSEVCYALRLPAKAAPGQSYAAALKDKILYAKQILSSMDDERFTPSFYAELDNILCSYYTEDSPFCKCAELLQNSDFDTAKAQFNSSIESVLYFYFDLGKNCLTSSFLYRIRKSDTPLPLRKDLFHVPKMIKQTSADNRFGLEDAPCLYLATSSNLAWLESRMPFQYNISCFWQREITVGWKIVYLISPQRFFSTVFSPAATHPSDKERRENQERMILAYFRQLPLIIACSFVATPQTIIDTDGHNRTPIPEYQIPNMLMSWIKDNHERTSFKGVAYCSSSSYADYLRYNGINIAIPAFNVDDSGYCKTLQEAFKLTKPKWINLADQLLSVKNMGEAYLHEYYSLSNQLDAPHWETLKLTAIGLTHLLSFFESEEKCENAETFYALLCSVHSSFDLLKMAVFRNEKNHSFPKLNQFASDVSNALHNLLNGISYTECLESVGDESKLNEEFNYIEN